MIIRKNATIGIDKSDTRQMYGRTLYRVVALATVVAFNVQPGARGGWCSKEAILSDQIQWIGANATFWGGTFWGGTFEGGTFEGGTFWGGTFRGGTFRGGTFEGGTFEGGTFEGGTFEGGTFEGGTTTARQPLFLSGFEYGVTITDNHMTIGCQTHALQKWWKFTPEEMIGMGGNLADKWPEYRTILKALCKASGRDFGGSPE